MHLDGLEESHDIDKIPAPIMEPLNAPLETMTNAMGIILTWRQLV